MALHDRVRDRLRPWHALMLVVFLAGTALQLAGGAEPFVAVLSGLFGLVVFQFTVGNVWASAVEYRNAGGAWSDAPFLAPFALAGIAAAAAYVLTRSLAGAASAAFWVFVLALAATAVVVNLAVGYRESDAADASQRVE
ncbi:hypothetical protein GRX01_00685 [Halobaculum sp. WSA2]|uniref:Uncharacterized protein n=1 Tax=Halobaculum saliterrae TaxID=2073113 RepID=A0A6B0SLV0_9EURY|nr:hypothetical protein [Halobaculum saliterrae]MXR39878.1 hypothetical protein [Halobaculum saliterrae]